jgi:hypothetical protein
VSHNYYTNQAPAYQQTAYPQNNMNANQVPVNNHGDQQKSVGSKGLSSTISTINHVSDKAEAKFAGFFDNRFFQ